MQIDEEVGKVAQTTPIVICNLLPRHVPRLMLYHLRLAKALELFLQKIIDAAAKESMNGSRKISKAILYRGPKYGHVNHYNYFTRKRTILKTEELDFLQALVKDVSDVEERDATPPTSPSKKRATPQRKNSGDAEQPPCSKEPDQEEWESEEGPFVKKSKSKDGLSKMRISALVEED